MTAGSGRPPARDSGPGRAPDPAWLRGLDAAAGLLAAGTFVLGVGLLVLAIVVPAGWGDTGIARAAGPGWSAAIAHLVVGTLGEAVVRLRRGWRVAPRALADGAVIGAVLVVLAVGWWP